MAALPPPPTTRSAAGDADTAFEATAWDELINRSAARLPRWVGARLRALVAIGLVAALALAALALRLADAPHWHAQWRADPAGRLELVASIDPRLAELAGRPLRALQDARGTPVALDAALLWRSPRWIVDDADRLRHAAQQAALRDAQDAGRLSLQFADGSSAQPTLAPRGLLGLGAMFWVMAALALVLALMAAAMLLLRPTLRSALYAAMSLAQAGNLLFIAVGSMPGLALPAALMRWDLPARGAFDLITAAAIVHATGIHPRQVRHRRIAAALAWGVAGVLTALLVGGGLSNAWWWVQGAAIAMGSVAIWQLGRGQAGEPHPLAVLLSRFGIVAVGTLGLLTLALALDAAPAMPSAVAGAGTVVWVVFLASLLLALPFLSRTQPLMREFALLAGVTTVATSLDLLFVAVFSLGTFASLTLAMFVSLAIYVGIRQWILSQMAGSNMLTTERMFEQLYRSAREVRSRPERSAESVSRLLRELFQPLEVLQVERETERARVLGNGSTLLVPLPRLAGLPEGGGTVVLRYAHRGQRLFTPEDARLTDRVLEQLKRAVDYDRAIEQGRSEERVRIAQDLHDDIGARLLTLMYQAPTPEVEDYVRHTLQDLKTLTRGLAAPSHKLSHAAAEWKTDITQRLAAAQCDLAWSFSADRDIVLSVVQWSALTRVLRELVSNTIAHARAGRVEIDALYYGGRLTLTVSDNGIGRQPQAWAHGLGLGGVRKRVKQLGGSVEWRENAGVGVRCEVVVPVLRERV
jgi:signal transduction histidine kinase